MKLQSFHGLGASAAKGANYEWQALDSSLSTKGSPMGPVVFLVGYVVGTVVTVLAGIVVTRVFPDG